MNSTHHDIRAPASPSSDENQPEGRIGYLPKQALDVAGRERRMPTVATLAILAVCAGPDGKAFAPDHVVAAILDRTTRVVRTHRKSLETAGAIQVDRWTAPPGHGKHTVTLTGAPRSRKQGAWVGIRHGQISMQRLLVAAHRCGHRGIATMAAIAVHTEASMAVPQLGKRWQTSPEGANTERPATSQRYM